MGSRLKCEPVAQADRSARGAAPA